MRALLPSWCPVLLWGLTLACATSPAAERVRSVERAAFFEERGRWTEAGEVWRTLRLRDPADVEAACGLARALAAQGESTGGLAVLTATRARTGDDVRVCLDQARLLRRLGRAADALEAYRAAAAADPSRPAPRIEGGALALELGRHEDAGGLLEGAVLLYPDDAAAWAALARARAGAGRGTAALEAWERAFALGRTDPEGTLAAGRLALSLGTGLERAEAWLARARGLAPQDAGLARVHGEVGLALGRDEVAVPALRRTLELDPGNLEVCEQLARVHERRGEVEAAARLREHARAVKGSRDL